MFLNAQQIRERIASGLLDRSPDPKQVQPASLDLRVGLVLVPGSNADLGRTTHVLGPSEAAVVETLEIVEIPPDLAAICFPPTGLSSAGILMTDSGHVDPGFKGHLSFTIINMSNEPKELRKHDTIATILLYSITSGDVWIGGDGGGSHLQRRLDALPRDFLQIEARARKAALTVSLIVPFAVGLLSLIGMFFLADFASESDLRALATKYEKVGENSGNTTRAITELKQRTQALQALSDKLRSSDIEDLERRVKALEE